MNQITTCYHARHIAITTAAACTHSLRLPYISLMIDWIVFYAVSAIFHPYHGGNHMLKVTG